MHSKNDSEQSLIKYYFPIYNSCTLYYLKNLKTTSYQLEPIRTNFKSVSSLPQTSTPIQKMYIHTKKDTRIIIKPTLRI